MGPEGAARRPNTWGAQNFGIGEPIWGPRVTCSRRLVSVASPVPAPPARTREAAEVRALPFQGDNAALVAGVLRGHPGAAAAFHDRYARRIYGLIYRLIGPSVDLEDVLHDTFVRALEALPKLKDPEALDAWVMGVAVRTARTRLQSRARRWWLRLMPHDCLPEPAAPEHDPIVAEALSAIYRVLDTLSVDDRVAFVLRCGSGMTVDEAAHAAGVSRSTLKRRLQRAETAFATRARLEPALEPWLSRGG
jgi:RNA polymerase sigma-70 factor (ECF subfamily)